ncbi:MAG: IS200/IS605 family transposase [Chloroflexota bacterium]|nr:IS200/IS605 family transposase [Chloroflexota bacterium]
MSKAFTQLYLHCVWATTQRLPLLTPEIEARVHACIAAKCRELDCTPIAIGGVEDHVHLLVELSTGVEVRKLMKEVKGASSFLVSHELTPDIFFRWQTGYGAFTVSHKDVPAIKAYLKNQKAHHAQKTLIPEWELFETQNASMG